VEHIPFLHLSLLLWTYLSPLHPYPLFSPTMTGSVIGKDLWILKVNGTIWENLRGKRIRIIFSYFYQSSLIYLSYHSI
jgi:hypothetical protein